MAEETYTQARSALEKANAVRVASAEWKRGLKGLGKEETIHQLTRAIEEEDPRVGVLTLPQLMRLVPRVGPRKAGVLLTAIDANGKRVRDLKRWQKARLLGALVYLGKPSAVRGRMRRDCGSLLPTLLPKRRG